MTSRALEDIALALVADGKGILAADESVPTLTKRFAILGIHSTEQSRRTYREMLFTAPGTAELIGGAIMYDETIRQKNARGGSWGPGHPSRHQGRHRRYLRRSVPTTVPGIVFLSGGQHACLATAHLIAINQLPIPKHWKVRAGASGSGARGMEGRDENLAAGRRAFCHRARLNGAASVGMYTG